MADEDVAFLDEYARAARQRSRSAVIQLAVRALKQAEGAPAYAQAWEGWTALWRFRSKYGMVRWPMALAGMKTFEMRRGELRLHLAL